MKAVVVSPGRPESLRLADRDPPSPDGDLLVAAVAVGICGTDHEIVEGGHGEVPPGSQELVLGHESLGRVRQAPPASGFAEGDLVAGIVRRPDPVPCAACADGHWDMCLNGEYVERGIKRADGYASELFSLGPAFAVRVPNVLGMRGVLVEPTSIVAKAWRRMTEFARINRRPLHSVLVTGAGPIGLLAALLAAQRGLEVHVLDRVTTGPKPGLVAGLGASYHTGTVADAVPQAADVVVECTGVGELALDAIDKAGPDGIVCLTGVSSAGRRLTIDPGALNRELVLENEVVFGTVNANRRHYQAAAAALANADQSWLERLITRRLPLDHWSDALQRRPDDVKVMLDLAA